MLAASRRQASSGEAWDVLRIQLRGLTQVSDQARQALVESRSPRLSAYGVPAATRPFSAMRPARAGKKVLNTPIGRPPEPGGMVRTKGGRKSSQDSRISASFADTSSAAFVSMPPE